MFFFFYFQLKVTSFLLIFRNQHELLRSVSTTQIVEEKKVKLFDLPS